MRKPGGDAGTVHVTRRRSHDTSAPSRRVGWRTPTWIAGLLLLWSAAPAHAQARGFPPGVELAVSLPPAPVTAGDQAYLCYELHLRNYGTREVEVVGVEVGDADGGASLASVTGEELTGSWRLLGPRDDESVATTLPAGRMALVYLWVPVKSAEEAPDRLRNRVTFASDDGSEPSVLERVVPVTGTETIVQVGPPLRGPGWFAANGPGNVSGHRRTILPLGGRGVIAQRYAIDYVLVRDGRIADGDMEVNESYFGYGEELIAVADAVVASTKDGIPDNVPGEDSRAVEITLETVAGNYVILDLGNGRYAFYAHLQPGSVRVRPGDRVTRGQVLGLLGNSGNSTGPHLHFHIADANSPLGADGLPYTLDAST